MLILFICSCGCSRYDYRNEEPLGSINIEPADIGYSESISQWDGSYTACRDDVGLDYYDDNLTIVNIEKRYSNSIITLYLNTYNVINDFQMDIEWYKGDILLCSTSSVSQNVIGGMFNVILCDSPEDYDSFKIISYNGNYSGDISNISIYYFGSDIVKESTTTYSLKKDLNNVALLTDNSCVWYGNLKKGANIIGRNNVTKYAIVEVK